MAGETTGSKKPVNTRPRFHFERENHHDSIKFYEPAEVLYIRFPQDSVPVIANIDFCFSNITSYLKQYDRKRVYAERNPVY